MKQPPCPYCRTAPVNHTIEKWTNFVNATTEIYLGPMQTLQQGVLNFWDSLRLERFVPSIITVLAKLKLVTIVTDVHELDSPRTEMLWKSAKERGIAMYKMGLFGRPTELTIARRGNRELVFMSLPRPQTNTLYWMDNKVQMKKSLMQGSIPVAKGREVWSLARALDVLKEIGGPVIVKPVYGSDSRHVTTHVTTEQELEEAFRIAKQVSPIVVIEEELQGFVYRVTLINKQLVAVLRREPPHVVGDGVLTVKQLVEKENQNPKRVEDIYFHPLQMSQLASEELKQRGLTWDSVPEPGELVLLAPRQTMARLYGATTTDVLGTVHPENVKLFTYIAEYLDEPLMGIDFIIQDMAKPWHQQLPCGVIELNSMPFLNLHHYPYRGNPVDASGILWDYMLPPEQ